jgi:hypothetical protein
MGISALRTHRYACRGSRGQGQENRQELTQEVQGRASLLPACTLTSAPIAPALLPTSGYGL